MTTTSERPATRPSTRPAGAPDADAPLRAAVPAALWALGAGFVCVGLPVLLVWAADSRSSSDAVAALRAAGQVWLVAHGVPLGLGAGRLSLTPLGLVLLPLGLLLRAGGSAARQHPVATLREAGLLTAAVAGPYALVAALVAVLSASAAVRPSVLGAVVGASVVALLGAGAGVLRASGLDSDLAGRVPLLLRRLLAPAGAAVLVVLGAGALLAGVRLALEAGRAAELARASAPGAVGGVALLLLGVALVPNAAVWGAPGGSAPASPSAPGRPSGRSPTSSARSPRCRCWPRCRRPACRAAPARRPCSSRWSRGWSPDGCSRGRRRPARARCARRPCADRSPGCCWRSPPWSAPGRRGPTGSPTWGPPGGRSAPPSPPRWPSARWSRAGGRPGAARA